MIFLQHFEVFHRLQLRYVQDDKIIECIPPTSSSLQPLHNYVQMFVFANFPTSRFVGADHRDWGIIKHP